MPQPQPPVDTIGERILLARLARGWSQRKLADHTGLSQSAISAFERGTRAVNRRSDLNALADAFGVAKTDLTGQVEQGSRSNPAAYATIPRLRVALMDSTLDDPPDAATLPVEVARRAVEEILDLRSRCDWLAIGGKLPILLDQLTVGAAADGPDREHYLRMLVMAARAAGDTVKDLGFLDLFYIASDRCNQAARALDEAAYIGVAEMQRSVALSSAKARARSLAVATRAADRLQPLAASDRLVGEMYGMLRLSCALSHAIGNDEAGAEANLAEADEMAALLGECPAAPVSMGMGFGPTNAGFWRQAILLELNNAPKAVEVGSRLAPERIRMTSRQASFHAEHGRALALVKGREADAVAAFRRSERLAPQRFHANTSVRDAVGVMLRRARTRAGGSELRGLADRLGVAV